jgi:tRNA(Ile)-lysidine synthase
MVSEMKSQGTSSPALIRTVRATIRRYSLFAPGKKVIIAVSGGIDSMVLLEMLTTLRELGLTLVVAHLNHLLRGVESELDEEFVQEAARRHGLPCRVQRVNVRDLAHREKRSLEDAGREARQRFLESVLRSEGADSVALAHHGDDQAETVLMRLLRGSGASGLAGMAPRSGWKVRPLLEATRQEIVEYARSREIAYREDRSNSDQRFLRNRIRHELLPLLATYNPLITRTLGATAAILAADDELLTGRAEQRFALLVTASEGKLLFPVAELLHEPDAVRFRVYRRAIQELCGDLRGISYRHLMDADRLLSHDAPSCSVSLPRNLRVGRVYDALMFSRTAPVEDGTEFTINGPGLLPLGRGELLVSLAHPSCSPDSLAPSQLLIDRDDAPFPWIVRTFREGDRMIPFGMMGSKKLKDIFIDLKVPRHQRREVPVLCDAQGGILAVLGVRRSALAPVTAATVSALLVELLPAKN